jgi:hypothetical protein
MSIRIMTQVWESAPYRGNTMMVLLALADWSDDEGSCWPNLESLARKARQSVRSVQYAIKTLRSDGILRAELNQGKGQRNNFFINTQILQVSKTRNTRPRNTQSTATKHANEAIAIRKNRHRPVIEPKEPTLSQAMLDRLERERRSRLTEVTSRRLRNYSTHPPESWEGELNDGLIPSRL